MSSEDFGEKPPRTRRPIRDLLAPRAKTLEGYLFPSTYRLSHKTTGGGSWRE